MRKKHSSIRQYFSYCPETNKSVCLCQDEEYFCVCGSNLSGNKASNLKNHVRRRHPKIYEEYSKNVGLLENSKLTVPTAPRSTNVQKFVLAKVRKKCSFIRQYFRYYPETNKSKCLCQNEDDSSMCSLVLRGNKVSNLKMHIRKRHPQVYENYLKTEETTTDVISNSIHVSAETQSKPADFRKRSTIRQFFDFCPETNRSECLCQNENDSSRCAFQLKGNKSSNLKNHIRKRHPVTYEEYLKTSASEKVVCTSPIIDVNNEDSPSTEKFQSNPETVSVLINKEDVLSGILESVTVNGRPLDWLQDSGFQKAFRPILKAANLNLNVRNCIELIKDRSHKIQNKLKNITYGKLICLKVDCVTKSNRLFIGIHIQLINDGKIVIFTVNTLELDVLYSGESLKQIVVTELEKFDINCENIYTVTIDNGANALKAVEMMDNQFNCGVEKYEYGDIVDASDLVECLQNYDWQENHIISLGCGAHMLQLCVSDTFKDTDSGVIRRYIDAIDAARRLVEIIINHDDVIATIESCNLEKPILDSSNRWICTYIMLERLLALKSHLDTIGPEHKNLILSKDTWELIAEIDQCLLPFQKATARLQNENLTITDVYKIFNICHMEIAEIGSPLSQELLDNMNKKRLAVFEHEVFLAAMFLDPRFSFELDDEHKNKAIKHLLYLHNKLKGLQDENCTASSGMSNMEISGTGSDIDDPAEMRYEKFLSQKHKSKLQASDLTPEFEIICRTFMPPRLKINENVLQFWEVNKHVYPDLYTLATIIFAVPSTQVSTSRMLSQLKLILSPQKSSWPSEVIDDVLIVNANFKHVL